MRINFGSLEEFKDENFPTSLGVLLMRSKHRANFSAQHSGPRFRDADGPVSVWLLSKPRQQSARVLKLVISTLGVSLRSTRVTNLSRSLTTALPGIWSSGSDPRTHFNIQICSCNMNIFTPVAQPVLGVKGPGPPRALEPLASARFTQPHPVT